MFPKPKPKSQQLKYCTRCGMGQVATAGQFKPCLACAGRGMTDQPVVPWLPFKEGHVSQFDRGVIASLVRLGRELKPVPKNLIP